MQDEMVDYFDETYTRLGSTAKKDARRQGLWVHSFHCWILRTSDEPSLFLQKRAASKELFPNYLDISAAGHLQAGETPEMGVREIEEEVGLSVKVEELISLGIKIDVAKLPNIINRQFCHVFLYPTETKLTQMKLDRSELDGMLEIPVKDGLRLFSGQCSEIKAKGMEKTSGGEWQVIEPVIGIKDFIPRVDPYYYKMFINADLYLSGYRHLSI